MSLLFCLFVSNAVYVYLVEHFIWICGAFSSAYYIIKHWWWLRHIASSWTNAIRFAYLLFFYSHPSPHGRPSNAQLHHSCHPIVYYNIYMYNKSKCICSMFRFTFIYYCVIAISFNHLDCVIFTKELLYNQSSLFQSAKMHGISISMEYSTTLAHLYNPSL